MEIKIGHKNNYHWLEINSDCKSFKDFISDFSEFILRKNIAIISFDSDSFIPTKEEYDRGWTYKNEIAYFNNLNLVELDGPIYDIYDQWFIFDTPTEIDNVDIFVNYSGFSLNSGIPKESLINGVVEKFWRTIERLQPSNFLLCGDYFIYGTFIELEIKEILKCWS